MWGQQVGGALPRGHQGQLQTEAQAVTQGHMGTLGKSLMPSAGAQQEGTGE